MSLEYPLINGHVYSFASITLKVDEVLYLGITRVDYSEQVDSVAIHGTNPTRVGRTVGKRKMTAEVEIQRREWNQLLPQLGANFSRQSVQLTIQYAEGIQPVITDSVEGYFVEVDSSNSEGTEPSTVKLTLDPTEIQWGASDFDRVSAEGAPTAPSPDFWLQNTDGIEGSTFADNPWDVVILGGFKLPGICKVNGLPTLAFDKKKAAGIDGATITVNGYLPGPIEIEVLMWTEPQWLSLQGITKEIWRPPNKGKTKASALAKPITHPGLALWGIVSVVVLGVSVPQDGPQQGTKIVKIKCVEYVPIKATPRTTTATGTKKAELVRELVGKNQAGDPPSKTGIHPNGPAQTRKGGVS